MKVITHGTPAFAHKLRLGDVFITPVARLIKCKVESSPGSFYASLGPFPHGAEGPRLYGGNDLHLDRCVDETETLHLIPYGQIHYSKDHAGGTILRTEDDVLHLVMHNAHQGKAYLELASGRVSLGEPGAIVAVYKGYRLEQGEGHDKEVLFAYPPLEDKH